MLSVYSFVLSVPSVYYFFVVSKPTLFPLVASKLSVYSIPLVESMRSYHYSYCSLLIQYASKLLLLTPNIHVVVLYSSVLLEVPHICTKVSLIFSLIFLLFLLFSFCCGSLASFPPFVLPCPSLVVSFSTFLYFFLLILMLFLFLLFF